MVSLSIKELLKFGWLKTKENLWFIIGFQILFYLVNFLSGDSILSYIVSLITGAVFTSVILRITENDKVDFKNIFQKLNVDKILHYFVTTTIVSIFVFAGFILLIVPGVIISLMTVFTSFIVLENEKLSWKDVSFWKAIKDSKKLTYGYKWFLFKFMLVALLINLLGLLFFGVGLLLSIPVTAIALASIYKKIKDKKIENNPDKVIEVVASA